MTVNGGTVSVSWPYEPGWLPAREHDRVDRFVLRLRRQHDREQLHRRRRHRRPAVRLASLTRTA